MSLPVLNEVHCKGSTAFARPVPSVHSHLAPIRPHVHSQALVASPQCSLQPAVSRLATDQQSSRPANRLVAVAAQPPSINLPLDRDLAEPLPGFDSIEAALQDLAEGKFVVVLDDENRENEGDLIINADKVTPEAMHFMVEHTSGVICIAMEGADLDRLKLPLMVRSEENEESMYTAFTITIDLREGTTTGISAQDRAATIKRMADPASKPQEFRRPGHIFPLRYRPGGVIVRPGHTEASVDLARLSGSYPAGVLCEIVDKRDGSMARTPQLVQFAKDHGLKCITIADLIRYRLKVEQLVQHTGSALVQSRHGNLTAHSFTSQLDQSQHLAFVAGSVSGKLGVPAAITCANPVQDLLGASAASNSSTSSGPALHEALEAVSQQGSGSVVYIRGGASNGLQLNGSQAQTSELSILDYGLATQMLRQLGVESVRLMSHNPQQAQALSSCGIKVIDTVPLSHTANGHTVVNGNGVHLDVKRLSAVA